MRAVSCAALRALPLGASCHARRRGHVTVTHDLDAARPRPIIAVPFAQIAALAPELRMYHVVVRDPKGRSLPSQITNYQHDHRGASTTTWCSRTTSRRARSAPTFTLEALPGHAAGGALRLRAHRARALRRHGLGERSHRAPHVRHRAEHARAAAAGERLRGSGIDVWGKRVTLSHRRSLVRQGSRPVPQGRRRRRPRSLQHRRLARRRRHRASGTAAKLWTSDNFVSAQVLSNGPRRAAFTLGYAPWDARLGGRCRKPSIHRRLRPELRHDREQRSTSPRVG